MKSDEIKRIIEVQEERRKRRIEDLKMRGGRSLEEIVKDVNYPELSKKGRASY